MTQSQQAEQRLGTRCSHLSGDSMAKTLLALGPGDALPHSYLLCADGCSHGFGSRVALQAKGSPDLLLLLALVISDDRCHQLDKGLGLSAERSFVEPVPVRPPAVLEHPRWGLGSWSEERWLSWVGPRGEEGDGGWRIQVWASCPSAAAHHFPREWL